MANLIFKCFLNNWNFIKIILKLGFANWHVLREICFRLLGLFLDTSFEIYVLHKDFDISRYRMSHLRWRVRKLSLTGLSWIIRWRDTDLRWIARKLAQGFSSTLRRTREVVLGSWSATVIGIYVYHILVFLPW